MGIFLTIFILILPTTVQGSEKSEDWNQYMNNVIEYINNNNLEAADYLLNNVFTKFQKSNLSSNEEEVLQPVFLQAIESMENTETSNRETYNHILRLQLALDAKSSTYQPMWTDREKEMMATFSAMEESLQSNDAEKLKQSFAMFREQYDIISPSLSLDLHKQEFSNLEADILYVEKKIGNGDSSLSLHIIQLEGEMRGIFAKYSGENHFPSFVWISTTIGSVIVISLIYTAVKKYVWL